MPKIYNYFGLIFLIITNDHNPIHVHVRSGHRQSIIEIFDKNGKVVDVKPRKMGKSESRSKMLTDKELNVALKFVNIKAEEFYTAWTLIRDGKFNQKMITITRKIV